GRRDSRRKLSASAEKSTLYASHVCVYAATRMSANVRQPPDTWRSAASSSAISASISRSSRAIFSLCGGASRTASAGRLTVESIGGNFTPDDGPAACEGEYPGGAALRRQWFGTRGLFRAERLSQL